MVENEQSEDLQDAARLVARLAQMTDALASEAYKNQALSRDYADDAELAHVQEQLRTLTAKADEIDTQATRLQQEAGSSASDEVEEARQQAQTMRDAAVQARNAINGAPTDPRTGKKRISSARLNGISGIIASIITEADHEVQALGAASTEGRAHNVKRATTATTAATASVATRVRHALIGKSQAEREQEAREHEEEGDFAPQMNRRDPRNRDGHISGLEIAGGTIGLGRAVFSRRKRATAARIVGEISTAYENDDRRGILDGSLSFGRGVANVTGSDDVGHVATVVVGTVATKSSTAGNLIGNLDVSGITGALSRNFSAIGGAATDMVGANTLANNIRPLLGQLMSDRGIDFEHLVNAKGVKQFDTDGNGYIDASEIISVLRNNGVASMKALDKDKNKTIDYNELRAELQAIAVRNHAYVEGRAPAPTPNPNRGRIVGLDGHGQIRIEQARTILENQGVRIDANRDGTVTYGECLAAIARWNETHNANGQPVAAAPRRAAPSRRQPD